MDGEEEERQRQTVDQELPHVHVCRAEGRRRTLQLGRGRVSLTETPLDQPIDAARVKVAGYGCRRVRTSKRRGRWRPRREEPPPGRPSCAAASYGRYIARPKFSTTRVLSRACLRAIESPSRNPRASVDRIRINVRGPLSACGRCTVPAARRVACGDCERPGAADSTEVSAVAQKLTRR